MRLFCDVTYWANVKKKALELIRGDSRSPAIRGFASVLEQVDFCPVDLKLALSIQDCAEGNTEEARSRIQALLALSPNDSDYLDAALVLASELQDKTWRRELLSGAHDHLRRFPYLLSHRILLLKHGDPVEGRAQEIGGAA